MQPAPEPRTEDGGSFASAGWNIDERVQLLTCSEAALIVKRCVVERCTKNRLVILYSFSHPYPPLHPSHTAPLPVRAARVAGHAARAGAAPWPVRHTA